MAFVLLIVLMKRSTSILFSAMLLLTACSDDQIQSALGNSKHVCKYKLEVFATVRNLSSRDLAMRFCSNHEDFKSVEHTVPADRESHSYPVWTYDKKESYYSSPAESCANKGFYDKSFISESVSIDRNELNYFNVCINNNDSMSDSFAEYVEKFVITDKNMNCPPGFIPYKQYPQNCPSFF